MTSANNSSANQYPLPDPRNNNKNNNNKSNNNAAATTTIKDKINIYNKTNGIGSLSTSSNQQILKTGTSSILATLTTTTTTTSSSTKNLIISPGSITTTTTTGSTSNRMNKNPPPLPPRPITHHNNKDGMDNNNKIKKKKSLVDSLGFSSASSKLAFPAKSRQGSYNNNRSENIEQSVSSSNNNLPILGESPRSNSSRFTALESIQRRASSITQEVSRRTSVMTSFRAKKPSTVENQKPLLSKTSDINIGQNGSSRQLSARLSYARTTSEHTLARAGRKKSENLFTKQEQRSIRLAATEAKIMWDDDNSRTSDDTSIVSDEDGSKSKRSTLVEVQNMYKDNQNKNFEMINPSTSTHSSSFTNGGGGSIPDHHFGMLIFTEGRDHAVIEEEEED